MKQWSSRPATTALFSAALLLLSCAPSNVSVREVLNVQEAKSIRYWGLAWLEKPLPLRIAKAPALLIKKLMIENDLYGLSERPVPAEPSPEFHEVLKRLEESLPVKVRKLIADRIIGIYLVNNLGSTGFTDTVTDENQKEKYAYIVLDKGVLLKRTANEWATWKENSVFKPQPEKDMTLNVVMESPQEDTVSGAIRLILMHEIGHVLGMASGIHPSWNEPAVVSDRYPFTLISWKMDKEKVASRYDDRFPEREQVRFYAFQSALLTIRQTDSIYRVLHSATDYPSLQASVDIWEDFAESFATYVHVAREGRPYEIRLQKEGEPATVYRSCWKDDRCERKKQFLKEWFEDLASRN
jgi:predicted Zn-dependent protease with MMP-like domain